MMSFKDDTIELSKFLQVEDQMVKSVKYEVVMSIANYKESKRVDWVRSWPGMVVLCVSQIFWSSQVQNCLLTQAVSCLEFLYGRLKAQMLDMVNLVKSWHHFFLINWNRKEVEATSLLFKANYRTRTGQP